MENLEKMEEWRYAEKSFEIRFCAALSAAIMPFNRNPLWLGMTQAQERKYGIDAVLEIGGRLIIFQFKAQSGGKIKIEREQLDNLKKVEEKFPDSVFYVFPEAKIIKDAACSDCIFKEAWCCTPTALDTGFKAAAKTASFTLNTGNSILSKKRPQKKIKVEKTCERFGCFCHSFIIFETNPGHIFSFTRPYTLNPQSNGEVIHTPFAERRMGIPIGKDLADSSTKDGKYIEAIRSVEQFEDLMGDGIYPNLSAFFIKQ